MKLEKRKASRVILSVPVHYKVFQLDQLEQDIQDEVLRWKAEIQDISSGGLQVVASQPFREGDILEIEVDIPESYRVRSVAKVVWCQREGLEGGYRSGIQFIPVYEDELKKLKDFLKGDS
jgi:Tfp pilus assembly protein PilZ